MRIEIRNAKNLQPKIVAFFLQVCIQIAIRFYATLKQSHFPNHARALIPPSKKLGLLWNEFEPNLAHISFHIWAILCSPSEAHSASQLSQIPSPSWDKFRPNAGTDFVPKWGQIPSQTWDGIRPNLGTESVPNLGTESVPNLGTESVPTFGNDRISNL